MEVHHSEGALGALEREQQQQARRAVLTLCAFTWLAYADLRTRIAPDKRVSHLWFARAAANAALKTIFLYAPFAA
eukprot:5512178-Prymnesium_polylepis.1